MVVDRTDLFLHRFGSSLTNENVVFSSYVSNNGFVEFVARNFGRTRNNHTAKRKNSYVGGSTANVDNHIADGGVDVEPCTDCGGNGFFNKVGLLCACLTCGIEHRLFLHLGNARGNTDHNVRLEKEISASATNEILNHLKGDFVLADNTVTQGSDCHNIAGSSTQHLLCLNTYLENAVGVGIDCHYRGLLQNNALTLHVNQNGCGAQVNANVAAELELLNKGFCAL